MRFKLTMSTLALISLNTIQANVDIDINKGAWSEALGKQMAIVNGHYKKCQGDQYCNMHYYRDYYTYVTSNGLQLEYNKDTFRNLSTGINNLTEWRK